MTVNDEVKIRRVDIKTVTTTTTIAELCVPPGL